jgi:hypothetical protein
VRDRNRPEAGDPGPKTKDGIGEQPSSSEIAKAKQGGNSELRFHPLADIFPLLEGAEFDALVADIKKRGVREDITLYEGKILDGRNRYRAAIKAGLKYGKHFGPVHYIGDDPTGLVISRNILRRHLTAEQKRDVLMKLVAAHPDKSDRALAREAKVDHKQISRARRKAEATGATAPVEKRAGADGKARKSPWSRERYKKLRARRRYGVTVETQNADGRISRRKATDKEVAALSNASNRTKAALGGACQGSVSLALGNPIIDAWEGAHKTFQGNFVRLYRKDLLQVMEEIDRQDADPEASAAPAIGAADGDIPRPDCVVRAARDGAS